MLHILLLLQRRITLVQCIDLRRVLVDERLGFITENKG